jgi:hypothetical protein
MDGGRVLYGNVNGPDRCCARCLTVHLPGDQRKAETGIWTTI